MNFIKRNYLIIKNWNLYRAFRPYLSKREILKIFIKFLPSKTSEYDFDSQAQSLAVLHSLLKQGESLSDKSIIRIIDNLTVVTNCDSAARYYLQAILPVLHHRPRLAGRLLYYVIRPLLYSSVKTGTM